MTERPLTFQERLVAKGYIPAPPEAPVAPVFTVLTGDLDHLERRRRAWVLTKLEQQAHDVATTAEGGRNDRLNAAAFSVGHYAPRYIDVDQVHDTLVHAGTQAGLDVNEARQAVRSGLHDGQAEQRDPVLTDDDPLYATAVAPAMPLLRGAGAPSVPLLRGAGAPSVPPKPGTAPTSMPPDPFMEDTRTAEEVAAAVYANQVTHELALLRIRHDAKVAHAAELAAKNFREPSSTLTLVEELLIPDEPISYAITDLLPAGGNALLTAQYKTGKTTTVGDLVRAWTDNRPFLGKFDVHPNGGRIAVFNYELSPNQYRSWLRDLDLKNPERATVLHLRGFRMPVIAQAVEDWVVNWLLEHEVGCWIVDPFARAFTGCGDENDNTQVGLFLDTLDVIKARAGVRDLILPVHTGRAEQEAGQERARGATRLDDWADVRWMLTKDENDDRFFRATGRDVEVGEERLSYDTDTRTLTFGGGDRAWTRRKRLEDDVVAFVGKRPGCSGRDIEAAVTGKREAIDSARKSALSGHRIRIEHGPKNAQLHYSNEV